MFQRKVLSQQHCPNATMKYIILCGLSATAATGANLRHVTDLAVDSISKHGAVSVDSKPEVTIVLTNYKGVEYTGPITIGGQVLPAIWDTGSFDIMVASDHCKSCNIPPSLTIFKNKSSKTFTKGQCKVTSHCHRTHWFAGGKVTARHDFDAVEMGSKEATAKVNNMTVWQVTDTTLPQWVRPELCKFTTIVGLGMGEFVPDTPEGHPPDRHMLHLLGTTRFATCFQKGATNPGFITLNPPYAPGAAGFAAMFRQVPVIGSKHWAVEQKGVSFATDGYVDKRCNGNQKCVAIIDSGTSLIGIPGIHMAFAQALAQKIDINCGNLADLPDLIFELGGQAFPLPASAYVLKMQGKCYAAFMQLSMASDHGIAWVLGLPFLRHYYTLWDRTGPSLFFAAQGDKCKPEASSNNSNLFGHASVRTFEPTEGDIREARMPSFMPHGSEKLVI